MSLDFMDSKNLYSQSTSNRSSINKITYER